MEFPNTANLQGYDMPLPREMLSARQKDGRHLEAAEIFAITWDWLDQRGAARIVSPQLLERYAMSAARWIQCEECITAYGFLAKHPTTGNAILSPYVSASQSFMKQANSIWYQIYQVVRENCTTVHKSRMRQRPIS